MSLIARLIYLGALVVAAIVYVAVMPPSDLNIAGFIQYTIPATGIGLLFILAKGVLGYGLTEHVTAIILVVGIIALASLTLSSTGMVGGVKEAVVLVQNLSNLTNTSLPLQMPLNVPLH